MKTKKAKRSQVIFNNGNIKQNLLFGSYATKYKLKKSEQIQVFVDNDNINNKNLILIIVLHYYNLKTKESEANLVTTFKQKLGFPYANINGVLYYKYKLK